MVLRFGPYVLDVPQRRLLKDGQDVPLTPKAFDVLALLAAERPRALAKDEILARVWQGVFVSDSTLATTIRDLRRALDDDADAPRYIRTAYAFGYAFIGEAAGPATGVDGASPWRLVLHDRQLVLRYGVNVVGRDEADVLTIDAPTISRRHARLLAAAHGVTCEDLGSKNGTWIGTSRVTTLRAAGDGDELRFGAVVAVLRRCDAKETETMSPDA